MKNDGLPIRLIPAPKSIHRLDGFFDARENRPAIRPDSAKCDCMVEYLTKQCPGIISENPAAPGRIILSYADDSASLESYELTVSPEGVAIRGDGLPGLFHGCVSLTQLFRLCGSKIPCCRIADAPDFADRGFYHDVTRGKVPTLETLKSLCDRLAFYKINQLQLYVEHTFAFEELRELWLDKDPLAADEIRDLDAYCRKRFIELVPSLATFGHLYELLRLKRFEHLNELEDMAGRPHDLWDRMAHSTIDVSNPESIALIRSMIAEFAPLFSSRRFNICCDETFDLGQGRNRELAARVGTGRLYVDFVRKIVASVREQGKTPMLWGDIVIKHPELIGEIPGDPIFLNWGYAADVTDEATATFARAGVRHYVCPGVQGWSRFANDIAEATANIRRMVGFGALHGAEGVLNTDWGDCGHVNFLANSMHGMALGAALSWNADSFESDGEFDEAVSVMEWGDGSVAALLRELGSLCHYHFGNIYAWVNEASGVWDKEQMVREIEGDLLAKNHLRAKEILESFCGLRERGGYAGDPQDLEEFIWSAGAILWTLELISFKKIHEYGQQECPMLYGSAEILLESTAHNSNQFKMIWLARNKVSEVGEVLEVFRAVETRIGRGRVWDPPLQKSRTI